jgi:hypothetical protein
MEHTRAVLPVEDILCELENSKRTMKNASANTSATWNFEIRIVNLRVGDFVHQTQIQAQIS